MHLTASISTSFNRYLRCRPSPAPTPPSRGPHIAFRGLHTAPTPPHGGAHAAPALLQRKLYTSPTAHSGPTLPQRSSNAALTQLHASFTLLPHHTHTAETSSNAALTPPQRRSILTPRTRRGTPPHWGEGGGGGGEEILHLCCLPVCSRTWLMTEYRKKKHCAR